MKVIIIIIIVAAFLNGCKSKENAAEEPVIETVTPVTVTAVSFEPVEEFVELNATSVFLQKSVIKSNVNGYIRSVSVRYADHVNAGQPMFSLQTKESDAIGNTINKLDPRFRFSGVNIIRAGTAGYVSELNHQKGDYVQDGEQLAVVSNANSFVFIMDVPYEYKQFVANNKRVILTLPDDTRIEGLIQTSMPFMDSVSQTQSVAIRVNLQQQIPQNLVARVKILKAGKPAAAVLPKSAVLSDEAHAEFWVMKLINDSVAVKIPVEKGIETSEKIEIISPAFQTTDTFLISGNYGLGDTAKVKIERRIVNSK